MSDSLIRRQPSPDGSTDGFRRFGSPPIHYTSAMGAGDWQRHLQSATRDDTGPGSRPDAVEVLGLTVLAHPDPRRVGEVAALPRLLSGGEVALSRLEPSFSPTDGSEVPRPLADVGLSRGPVMLRPGSDGGVVLEARNPKVAVELDGEPLSGHRRLADAELDAGVVVLLSRRVALVLHRLGLQPPDPPAYGLVGASAAIAGVRQEIRRVAPLSYPVLLRGESGTGKELVARALHDAGPRVRGPFVDVNLAALPPSLAAAELFGAARGAFTGADRRRRGLFERADGGTLFLDEVAAAPTEVQAMLLRVLETGRAQPVGGEPSRRVDVRVVAATDATLEDAVETGRFSLPLLHRLAGYEIELPPLRRRREDFGRLLLHFLRQELATAGAVQRLDPVAGGRPWLPAPLVARLARLAWPGNVRQLRNAVRQIAVRGAGKVEAELPPLLARRLELAPPEADPTSPATPAVTPRHRPPEDVDPEELLAALRRNRFNLTRAAAELGLARSSLYALVDRSPFVRKASEIGGEEIEKSLARCAGRVDDAADELQVSQRGLLLRMKELELT